MSTGRRGQDRTGAVAQGDGTRKRRPAWLWLLGLLLLAALIGLLIALLSGGDDKKKSSGSTGAQGTLTADGQSLLPPSQDGTLKRFNGRAGEGRAIVVQSIVKGEGFWVGTSQTDRVYVEFGGQVGQNENGFHPTRTGVKVNLTGPVRDAPKDPAKNLKLSSADAQLVQAEGIYINADRVEPAK